MGLVEGTGPQLGLKGVLWSNSLEMPQRGGNRALTVPSGPQIL